MGGTIFTSMVVIGGKLYSNHPIQGLTTSDVRDVEGTFVVNLLAQKVDSHF